MIVPSIDIQNGQTVQLIGGKELAIESGDPHPIAVKFGRVGEVAVIDLDAAMSVGSNAALIKELLPLANCRVGGGIRDLETAIQWLDAGAKKIIIGTAAEPELLSQLPRERIIVALDGMNGEVVDQGWQNRTGASVLKRIEELRSLTSGFLITFVEREGRMVGVDFDQVKQYRDAVGDAKLTIAGGVTTAEDIAKLDALGVDAQIGMAIYTGKLPLANGFCGPLKSDRSDQLWPTIVADRLGKALGLTYSNLESVGRSIESGDAHYWSRKRGLWKKGAESGNTQKLIAIDVDCDRDTLRFSVDQQGVGFCHLQQSTCFGEETGMAKLQSTLQSRIQSAPAGSYTRRLFEEPELLKAKILEEAEELTQAEEISDVVHESADLFYFLMANLAARRIGWEQVEAELERRSLKISRRPGNAKVELSKP